MSRALRRRRLKFPPASFGPSAKSATPPAPARATRKASEQTCLAVKVASLKLRSRYILQGSAS
eukprot:4682457-Alexandrium_andersonii.AAC.1